MIFLAPHNDDETLFGSFLIQQHQPRVVVCLRSIKQQHVTFVERELETAAACRELGVGYEQWDYRDTYPDWERVGARMAALDEQENPQAVFAPAPAWGLNGHSYFNSDITYGALHHDFVGHLALEVFGPDRVVGYTTYTRYEGRTLGVEVVPTGRQVEGKLRALACYRSQIEDPGCRPHFLGGLHEYVAA